MRDQKQREKKIAASFDCITIDSLNSLNYTYVYESNLPCRVYLNSITVEDISTSIDDYKQDGMPCWIGNPSPRINIGWIKAKDQYFYSYIGFDSIQKNWVLKNAKESKSIQAPVIINVYQVRKFYDNRISYKADLIGFCEDGVSIRKIIPHSDSLQQVLDTIEIRDVLKINWLIVR